MGNRLVNPDLQFLDGTPEALEGAGLFFYVTTTSTKTDTYSDAALTTPNANPIVLDADGRPTVSIFLDPAVTYRVGLAAAGYTDPPASFIKTWDPVVDHAANVTAAFQVYAGDPNGNVAGNAGVVGGSGASVVWDISSNLMWICTSTGTTSTAVWTQQGAAISGAVSFTGEISPASLSANQDDYAPTGFSTCSQVRQTSSLAVTITGMAGGGAGRFFTWHNISSYAHTFAAQSGSSTAANRFALTADLVVPSGQSRSFWYDATTARWRLLGIPYNRPFTIAGGRLTLETGVPVTTSDQTGKTTIYYAPYVSNTINLWDGLTWNTHEFSELSQTLADTTKSPAAAAINSIYDMFVWNDAGTLRCTRGPAWSSSSARGTGAGTTEIERVGGVLMNKVAITNGPAANRGVYVGSIATNGSGANGEMAMMYGPAAAAGGTKNRLDVWNMYNRVSIRSVVRDSTNTWSYSTATWRSSNNSTSNRVTFINGLNEALASAVAVQSGSSASSGGGFQVGIGIDSASANHGLSSVAYTSGSGGQMGGVCHFSSASGLGSHYLQMVERGNGTSCDFFGDNSDATAYQSGMIVTTMS